MVKPISLDSIIDTKYKPNPKYRRDVHRVKGLMAARLISEGMPTPSGQKLTAAMKRGRAFENKVGQFLEDLNLGQTFRGQWIEYCDNSGWHMAQPDIFILRAHTLYLIEVKLTQNDDAERQMLLLYKPLLDFIYPTRKIICVQICKNLITRPKRPMNLKQLKQGRIWKKGPWTLHLPLL